MGRRGEEVHHPGIAESTLEEKIHYFKERTGMHFAPPASFPCVLQALTGGEILMSLPVFVEI